MVKKSLLLGVLAISLLFGGCSDKKNTNVFNNAKFEDIKIGNKLADFTIEDQFNKKHSLQPTTKKIIFAFSKPMGHIIKEYLKKQPVDYLSSRDILFIADISGMPKIIFKMFALSDMQKSKYPMLLILDEKNALRFKDESKKDFIMILSLDNKVIKNIEFINNEEDLKKAID